jgi:hypothetical protein
VYFRELYLAKMRVQRVARASAMAHAMGACEVDPRAGLEKDVPPRFDSNTDPNPKPQTFDTKGKQKADEALGGLDRSKTGTPLDTITKITLTTSASAMTKPDPTGKKQGFSSDDVGSSSFVTCGDKVTDGQYEEILPHITDIFGTFFK